MTHADMIKEVESIEKTYVLDEIKPPKSLM